MNDEQANAQLRRFTADPRWAREPFRRLLDGVLDQVPQPVAVKLLAWCEPHVIAEPDGAGWLAEHYRRLGVPDRAGQLLDAATNRPGATPDDWLRLAMHRDPSAVMQVASTKLRPQPFLALAAVFVETPAGNGWSPSLADPAAKRLFAQSRLAVKLSRSEPAGAAKVLEGYLAEKEIPKVDEGWAKRNLAMLYAVGGTAQDRKRAMDLIQNVDDFGTTPDEMRATAGVLTTLARYLEGDDRTAVLNRASLALVKAHQKSQSPRDLYHLSQVYRAVGNRPESRKCLQQLLNVDPNNIYYLTAAL
jgi:hypothetical protein